MALTHKQKLNLGNRIISHYERSIKGMGTFTSTAWDTHKQKVAKIAEKRRRKKQTNG